MIEYVIIPIVVALDQATKWYIRANFRVGETLPLIPDILHITYVRNQGAAFSMFRNMPFVTVLIPIMMVIACLALTLYFRRHSCRVPAVLTALVAAGGIGNLIDRLVLGYVTDMIDFRVFPVFNVADIAVTVGCILLIIWILRDDRMEKVADDEVTDPESARNAECNPAMEEDSSVSAGNDEIMQEETCGMPGKDGM